MTKLFGEDIRSSRLVDENGNQIRAGDTVIYKGADHYVSMIDFIEWEEICIKTDDGEEWIFSRDCQLKKEE